jgi:hypothetical protein
VRLVRGPRVGLLGGGVVGSERLLRLLRRALGRSTGGGVASILGSEPLNLVARVFVTVRPGRGPTTVLGAPGGRLSVVICMSSLATITTCFFLLYHQVRLTAIER